MRVPLPRLARRTCRPTSLARRPLSGKKRGPKPKTDEEKEQAKKRARAIKQGAAEKHDKSEYMASKGFKTLEDYQKLVEGKANEKGEEYWKDHYKR